MTFQLFFSLLCLPSFACVLSSVYSHYVLASTIQEKVLVLAIGSLSESKKGRKRGIIDGNLVVVVAVIALVYYACVMLLDATLTPFFLTFFPLSDC